MKIIASTIAAFAAASMSSSATVVITEWMYQGGGPDGVGEFFELTNIGTTTVDFNGWSYDDDSRNPGVVNLSSIGLVQPGQSVIISELGAEEFRANWGLSSSVVIFGGLTVNLGRADEINIFDQSGNLVDRLTFGDAVFPGSPRTQSISGITDPDNYGTNDAAGWYFSSVADGPTPGDGISWMSNTGEIGNPGVAAIPEPSGLLLLGAAGLGFGMRRKRA